MGSIPSSGTSTRKTWSVIVALVLTASAIGLDAQITSRALTPDEQIAAAEARGAGWPRAAGSPQVTRNCLRVRPEQIVFPSTSGDPSLVRLVSGDFSAASLSFGWDQTYIQAKMPLQPRTIEPGLTRVFLEITRIDPAGSSRAFEFPIVAGSGDRFFATWPEFPTPGRWMIVATAGTNWGCFVLDRPVR